MNEKQNEKQKKLAKWHFMSVKMSLFFIIIVQRKNVFFSCRKREMRDKQINNKEIKKI